MTYQKTTGALMANSHPGSYCGQDAYNGMFVTEEKCGLLHRERTTRPISTERKGGSIELYARPTSNIEGGYCMETAVRRLTELECERLQGFPDNWTLIGEPEEVEVKDYEYTYDEDGNVIEKVTVGTHKEIQHFYTDENGKRKKCTASARYKALGNSIALPFWQMLARRICAQYERDITMGSLFDGIGGFPLVFEKCGAKAVWASEVEPFCIEVTKRRFKEE